MRLGKYFYIMIRNKLTGVVKVVSGNRSFGRFKDRFENYLTLNQLTIATVYSSPVTKETEVSTIYAIHNNKNLFREWILSWYLYVTTV